MYTSTWLPGTQAHSSQVHQHIAVRYNTTHSYHVHQHIAARYNTAQSCHSCQVHQHILYSVQYLPCIFLSKIMSRNIFIDGETLRGRLRAGQVQGRALSIYRTCSKFFKFHQFFINYFSYFLLKVCLIVKQKTLTNTSHWQPCF